MRAPRNTICLAMAFVWFGSVTFAAGAKTHQFGPTGLQGSISKTTIKITKVAKGSPADGKIKVGDVITGVADQGFRKDIRRQVADAIDEAETKASGGKLTLNLTGGKKVELQLEVLGSYSDTAPYNCPKTEAIVKRAADHLLKTGKLGGGLRVDLLGLLATGEQKYIDAVREVVQNADWAKPDLDFSDIIEGTRDAGYVGWYWGYTCIFLSEYHLLTGDEKVLPALKAYAVALAKGQDPGGLWGHRMATKKRNGRLPGYGQMNQPSLSNFMGLLLAQKCGIKDPALDLGVDKTYAFYKTFIGKGTLPYGVHGPNSGSFNNNGMSATAALCMAFKGNKKGSKFFSQMAATSYDILETGHAGHYFNTTWTPLGANLSGPEVTAQFFKKSRWLQTLYRAWDGGFTFDGAGYKSGNSTGAHLLTYCIPRKTLLITGRDADPSLWLKGQQATDTVELSQVDYKSKSADELIALFGHPMPQVTRRAVWTLREKEGEFIPKLVKMLKEGTKIEKQSAIGYFGYKCPADVALPRLDDLGAILRNANEDPEVKAAAAASLSFLGEPAYKYYNDMLKLIVDDEPGDVFRDVDQSVGGSVTRLCAEPFKAGLVTDKDLFYKAALKLMTHKRQHGRAPGVQMIESMPLEDFHLVADELMHIIRDKDNTYHSYHNPGHTVGPGIAVLANLNIKEGMPCALDMINTESGKWSFKVFALLKVLQKYGANAKPVLEKLKADPRFKNVENNGKFKKPWAAMLKAIEEDSSPAKLMTFEEAKKAGGK